MADEPKRSIRSIRLTKREREFLLAYMSGLTLWESYQVVKPGVARSTAEAQGSRYMKRIEEKIGWAKLLDAADLGESRLVKELGKRYEAKHTVKVIHEERRQDGKVVKQRRAISAPDERVRMRATQLHALLLGKNRAELDLHHSGPGGEPLLPGIIVVRFVKPNGPDEPKNGA